MTAEPEAWSSAPPPPRPQKGVISHNVASRREAFPSPAGLRGLPCSVRGHVRAGFILGLEGVT